MNKCVMHQLFMSEYNGPSTKAPEAAKQEAGHATQDASSGDAVLLRPQTLHTCQQLHIGILPYCFQHDPTRTPGKRWRGVEG